MLASPARQPSSIPRRVGHQLSLETGRCTAMNSSFSASEIHCRTRFKISVR